MAMSSPTPDASDLVKRYRQRNAALQNQMALQIPIWTNIRDFLAPRTARFPGERKDAGLRQDYNIINIAPRLAVRTLPAGMQSGMTSPIRPWFRFGTPDPDLQEFKDVKVWLYHVERLMREIFNRSNLYDRLKSNYHINGTYGTSCLFIEEDFDEVIRAYDFPIGSFKPSTNASGRVDSVYRDLVMTSRQLVEKFGEKAPVFARLNYDNSNYEAEMPVTHIIEPNKFYDPNAELSESKETASVWLDLDKQGDEAMMRYSGYDYMPAMVPRWDVLGEDTYGTGCGDYALGDAKQLQHMEKRKLQGIDKNVAPTMLADGSMRNQRVSNLPGDTVYVNGLITGNKAYQPAYMPNPYINELREESGAVSARIDEAFYKNLFLMVSEIADQPNITATQINTMREEKLLMLGPVLERMNNELLGPLIDATFKIMLRRGMVPPPPPEIQGQPLRIEYISVLAQAQKAMGIGNIERFVSFVGNVAQATQNLDVLDKLNVDEAVDAYADGVAVPPSLVRTADEVAPMRQNRQQQAAAAQAAQQGLAATQAAKNLGDTPMQGENALTRIMQTANVQS